MTSFQKVIKYGAYALALTIIIFILRIAVGGLLVLGGFIDQKKTTIPMKERKVNFTFENYNKVKVETGFSKLTIKVGDYFSIITNNDELVYGVQENEVFIRDNQKQNFTNLEVLITLPKHVSLAEFELDSGSGEVTIDMLEAKKIDISTGAGKLYIRNIIATESLELESGIGSVTISEGLINNLYAELGIGQINISTILTGNNKIEAGLGEIRLNLLDDLSNYKLRVEKGLGSIKLNNTPLEKSISGEGVNYIEISGGIGEIKIFTKKQ